MRLPASRASTAPLPLRDVATAHAADPPGVAEAPFLAENTAAMGRMMAGIAALPISDATRDLAAMMIVHHHDAFIVAPSICRQHSPTRGT